MSLHNNSASHSRSADTIGRKIRRSAIVVVLVLIVGFIIIHFIKASHEDTLAEDTKESSSTTPLVDVITVSQSPAALMLKLPGETASWYESIIYARVDGYVGKWMADIGDHVKKGQILATIETPDLDAQLTASKAKLNAAEAMVKARQSEADFAKTTYARWKDAPKGVVSEQEREAKKAAFNSAVANLNEAKAQVVLDRADVDRFTVLAQFKQVTAPYDGRITERRIDIGNLVMAGSSANTTPLYRMSKNNPIRVFVDVPQSVASDIKVGSTAEIQASNIANRVFEGKVARTAEAINAQSRTLRVELDVPNADKVLLPGLYVDVNFKIASKGLLQIPAAALMFTSEGPEVATIDKDQRVSFHKVTIARDDGNTLEIGSGISNGDRLALNISSQIADGEKVEIHAPDTK
jgi:RND family efflux transporter MFP subunit